MTVSPFIVVTRIQKHIFVKIHFKYKCRYRIQLFNKFKIRKIKFLFKSKFIEAYKKNILRRLPTVFSKRLNKELHMLFCRDIYIIQMKQNDLFL